MVEARLNEFCLYSSVAFMCFVISLKAPPIFQRSLFRFRGRFATNRCQLNSGNCTTNAISKSICVNTPCSPGPRWSSGLTIKSSKCIPISQASRHVYAKTLPEESKNKRRPPSTSHLPSHTHTHTHVSKINK